MKRDAADGLFTKRSILPFAAYLGLWLLLLSCACSGKRVPSHSGGTSSPYKIGKHWYYPVKHSRGFSERGIASWYGKECHGRKTASGEVYNMYAMTAAHKTLPMGTYVRVHNLDNGKRTVVKVNDRGPFVRGRIIDLSYRAARKIGLVGPGTAPVKIAALGRPKETRGRSKVKRTLEPDNYDVGDFSIQVGAFRDKRNAVRLRNRLARTYKDVHIAVHEGNGDTVYRVRVARCTTLDQAIRYEKKLEADGYPGAVVVAR